jgi:hypothetical protein
MKNLKTVCTILICAFYSSINAQDNNDKQQDIANFQIKEASENGKDITSLVVNRDYYLSLYKSENSNNIYFSVICESDDSQSYGSIYSIKHETLPDSEINSKSELYSFYWSYNNTYNAETGTAKIKLLIVYEPTITLYTLRMQYENLEEYVYKGFIEGDISSLACETKDNK